MDQYNLLGKAPGDRKAEDAWIDRLAMTIYGAHALMDLEPVQVASLATPTTTI